MMSIIFKEKLNMTPDALMELIVGCNQDVRQVLHHLSMMKMRKGIDDGTKMSKEQGKIEADRAKKTSIKIVTRPLSRFASANLKLICFSRVPLMWCARCLAPPTTRI